MQISFATQPSPEPGRVNEDYVLAGPDFVILLDGATAPAGIDSGCVHTVAWYVRHLAAAVAQLLITRDEIELRQAVHDAIAMVVGEHGPDCDLTNNASPSATVAIVRRRGGELDYFALADSPIVLEDGTVIVDDRTSYLPDYSREGIEAARNRPGPGGFFVAQTDPGVVAEAVVGTVPMEKAGEFAMFTDGASRFTELFKLGDWAALRTVLVEEGPDWLINRVRASELATPPEPDPVSGRRFKRYDDATAVLVQL
ncbi:protein phosphatase 2C domain-containing protein [Amycolatopsis kentuckyensis]|uniref:protein phosphatase 2C domain-containing protein n=1 Tax=Amycolatopsis kentuckyensis TaxID=218823 RepID=UPI003569DD79